MFIWHFPITPLVIVYRLQVNMILRIQYAAGIIAYLRTNLSPLLLICRIIKVIIEILQNYFRECKITVTRKGITPLTKKIYLVFCFDFKVSSIALTLVFNIRLNKSKVDCKNG
jgi:hypothetical protein